MTGQRRTKRFLVRLAVPFAPFLTVRRPLAPFPNYTFGASEHPSGIGKTRERIWRYLRESGKSKVITTMWYEGLRVAQHLGDDQSRCLYVSGCIDPNEMAFVAGYLRLGMVFVDVGANQGLYTLLASRKVGPMGRVVSVEPSQRELSFLRRNLDLNHLTNVVVQEVALSDSSGTALLRIANIEHGGHNTLGHFVYDDVTPAAEEPVLLTTLDLVVQQLNLPRVDLIKVDAEGCELAILQGGKETLRQHKPAILVEVQDSSLRHLGASADQLLAFIEAEGYDLYEFSSDDGLLRRVSGCPSSLNVVALPR